MRRKSPLCLLSLDFFTSEIDFVESFSLSQARLGDSIPKGLYNFVGVRPNKSRDRVRGVAVFEALLLGVNCSSNL